MSSEFKKKVEYAGYLLGNEFGASENHPMGKGFGGASTHPQFKHMDLPPDGYSFSQNPGEKDYNYCKFINFVIDHLFPGFQNNSDIISTEPKTHLDILSRIASESLCLGGSIDDFKEFLKGRNILEQSQLAYNTRLAFIPTVPYTLSLTPWVIEIEDSTTLFFPYIHNGNTVGIDAKRIKFYPAIRSLLESSMCKAIITHIESTAKSLPILFDSHIIASKVVYSPLGISVPGENHKPIRPQEIDSPLTLLFTNSWNQFSTGFYLRGGHDVLEAFSKLSEQYPQLNLIIRSQLPEDLTPEHFELVKTHPRIRVIDQFLTDDELHNLMLDVDIYLVPSARIHVVSALKALSYGIPVIASDGWGFSDYVSDGENGYLLPGRYGVCSWIDWENGMLREDYSSIKQPNGTNETIIQGLIEKIAYLLKNRNKLHEMSTNARGSVKSKFNLEQWNQALKQTFDKVFLDGDEQAQAELLQAQLKAERFEFQYRTVFSEISGQVPVDNLFLGLNS